MKNPIKDQKPPGQNFFSFLFEKDRIEVTILKKKEKKKSKTEKSSQLHFQYM